MAVIDDRRESTAGLTVDGGSSRVFSMEAEGGRGDRGAVDRPSVAL